MPSPSSIEEKTWQAIVDLLTTSQGSGILVYVKNIFEGVRELPDGSHPSITLEPDDVEEQPHTMAGPASKVRIIQRISIHCMIEHMDLTKQIKGSGSSVQGIFDLTADVKNVLKASPKLGLSGENVLWVRFPSTRYFFDNFPVREAIITAEVQSTRAQTNR